MTDMNARGQHAYYVRLSNYKDKWEWTGQAFHIEHAAKLAACSAYVDDVKMFPIECSVHYAETADILIATFVIDISVDMTRTWQGARREASRSRQPCLGPGRGWAWRLLR